MKLDNVEILHKFESGRSGSDVFLAKINNKIGVFKTNIKNINIILEKHKLLPFNKPEIYDVTEDNIFMEYIPGISIKEYLKTANKFNLDNLIFFIGSYFDYCLNNSIPKDYTILLKNKMAQYSTYSLSYNKFNQILPQSIIHGDFTFDNLLYYNEKFYMIDVHATEFDSIYFDANKLRQDLTSGWFIRAEENKLNWQVSCAYIYNELNKKYPTLFNNEIYKFMLLRVLPYCNIKTEQEFLIAEIDKLCK